MSNVLSQNIKYIMDANILIGFSLWTPIALNGGFWNKLEQALEEDKWILLDVVVDEIKRHNIELKKWCERQQRKGLVVEISKEEKYRGIEINNQYEMIDQTSFNSTVDTYIIAHAEANGLGVFSRESNRANSNSLYKIPDVCHELKIDNIRQPLAFLKRIGFKST